ncbi:MAG TPA: DUF58 domain-containing protein [Thermoanaerobaculia bacterium]
MPVRFDPADFAALGTLTLKARYVMEGFLHGVHGSPFHGPSVEFADYRDYQPGDDLRHLDWRLYARNDRLCIKRFEQETNARCYVLCDTSGSMSYRGARAWGSKLDCARVAATALGWFLLRQNDAVGLIALRPDAGLRYLRPSQKGSQLGRFLGEAEALAGAGGERLAALLEQTSRLAWRRSLILLFSDLLEPAAAVETGFRRLRFEGHECIVFQVLDPDEIDFPFADGTVLEDLETLDRRQFDGGGIRELYRERFAAFMAAHRELFRQLEIPHVVLRTDEDPGRVLGRFLAERARRS